jgi:hypothetical protein
MSRSDGSPVAIDTTMMMTTIDATRRPAQLANTGENDSSCRQTRRRARHVDREGTGTPQLTIGVANADNSYCEVYRSSYRYRLPMTTDGAHVDTPAPTISFAIPSSASV